MLIICDRFFIRDIRRGKSQKGNEYCFIEALDETGGDISLNVNPTVDLSEFEKLKMVPLHAELTVKPEKRGYNQSLTLLKYSFKQ